MFLSSLVSQLEPDGSLIADLADDDGPRLRFGPLSAGMTWDCWEQDRWVATDVDHGVSLVTDAHLTRRDLPVLRYLAEVPKPAIEQLLYIHHWQATVLQLWARFPAARDLLQNNLILLWLVADSCNSDAENRQQLAELFDKPQAVLLEWALKQPVRPAQVRFLRKLVLDAGDRSTLSHIRRLVSDEDTVMRLRHWRRVPSGLLSLLAEAPYLADFQLLRSRVDRAADGWEANRFVRRCRGLLRDTVRLMELLKPAPDAARIINNRRSWSGIKTLHDELVRSLRAIGWEKILDSGADPSQEFPPPPIPSDTHFIAIGTIRELVDEGEKMHHCVITRAPEAMQGACAVYRVNANGHRGTLEVEVGARKEPVAINDFRLALNAEPPPDAWEAANKWLAEGRKAWASEGGQGVER